MVNRIKNALLWLLWFFVLNTVSIIVVWPFSYILFNINAPVRVWEWVCKTTGEW